MKTTGEKLKDVRTKRGYTLDDVAKAIGTTATTISKYESGKVTNIPQKKLEAIAEYLEINPSFLLGYDNPEFQGGMVLNINEQLMMEDYRMLSAASQETINILIQRLKEVESAMDKPSQLYL